jgi:acyl-coenzyme A thioesterase PaaI-like protein
MPTPLVLPWKELEGYHCFGCCAENPAGLKLEPVAEAGGLACALRFSRLHESYPGIVHGGIGATVLDELMGNVLALLERKICFTTAMKVRYLGPLRTGVRYAAAARIVERPAADPGLFKVEGEIRDTAGEALVMATASYQWLTAAQADELIRPSPAGSPGYAAYFRAALSVP